jgi:hypothetical protein
MVGVSTVPAQSAPSVAWLAEDLNLPLREGTAVDFAFPYEVRLAGGADPEGDATLTLRICENHRCHSVALAPSEGTSFQRYGIDPTVYHRGLNVFTLTLTLTDNGETSADTLTIRARVNRLVPAP